ncbi:MAG TPA: SsrA-binding protein SmpB [Candidatus Limnocylindrales bacterium]|nr:SsrA-binding protein SmpB [Candidatus Limnocylindrales bacterium]
MDGIKIMARNRRAGHDYFLEESLEAGLVLVGSEIKSIRQGKVTLSDGYVEWREGELWLLNVHISSYEQAGIYGRVDPMRPRKLLMHRKQIRELRARIRERGYTIVPTMVYLRDGRAKVEIALAKGKRQYDKREAIAKRDSEREVRQAMKERGRE